MYVLNWMFHIQEIGYLMLDEQLKNGSKYQMDLTQKKWVLVQDFDLFDSWSASRSRLWSMRFIARLRSPNMSLQSICDFHASIVCIKWDWLFNVTCILENESPSILWTWCRKSGITVSVRDLDSFLIRVQVLVHEVYTHKSSTQIFNYIYMLTLTVFFFFLLENRLLNTFSVQSEIWHMTIPLSIKKVILTSSRLGRVLNMV